MYFLKLIKIPDGTAETIERAIFSYLQDASILFLKYQALVVMELQLWLDQPAVYRQD